MGLLRKFLLSFFLSLSSFSLFFLSCAQEQKGEQGQRALSTQGQRRLLGLLSKGEQMQSWREDMQKLYMKTMTYGREHRGKIFARHLDDIQRGVHRYRHSIVPGLRAFTHRASYDFFGKDFILQISSDEKSVLERNYLRFKRAKDLRSSRQRRRGYRKVVTRFLINPRDELGRELFRELLYQVSGRLLILDNFSLGLIPYINQRNLRYALINSSKNDSSRLVEDMWHDYVNTLYRSDQLEGFIESIQKLRKMVDPTAEQKILLSLLDHSVTGRTIEKRLGKFTFFKDIFKNMSFMAKRRWSAYKSVGTKTLYQASKIFGNAMGLFQFRRGKLYSLSKKEEEDLSRQFLPLDILVEKTPFRLTDKFIPGYFGHTAIWTGSERELREIGVWDKLPHLYAQAVKKYAYRGEDFQRAIRKGTRIIEALRPGVRFSTFRQFLDIDDLLVLRPEKCEEGEQWKEGEAFCLDSHLKREYLIKAFSQIGKDYDFAFDVNSDDKIVCSELIYRTYLDIDFETSLTLGSYNISPDQVVKKADEEGEPFFPLFFIYEGKRVETDIRALLQDLL